MPRAGKCHSMPLSSWPELDREAWLAAMKPVSLFSAVPKRRRWKAITWTGVETGYGFWLSWLRDNGLLEVVDCPAARVSQVRLQSYIEQMQLLDLADYTVAGRLGDVGRALSVMRPESDTAWIELAASRLHADAAPAKDLRRIVRPAVDLVDLGFGLMLSTNDTDVKGGSYSSLRFRDGLLIALLIHCPLRRRNLAALELERHVYREEGIWRIDIPAAETKTGRAIRCPWPLALVDGLETYLSIHRKVLLNCGHHDVDTGNLWVSRQGGPASAGAIYQAVCERTEAAFGEPINPHVFRHIVATDLATVAPECATAIMDILGHSSMGPSEKYYNRSRTIGAAQRMHGTIEVHRNAEVQPFAAGRLWRD